MRAFFLRSLSAAAFGVCLFGAVQAQAAPVTLFDSITGYDTTGVDPVSLYHPIYASFSTTDATTLKEIDIILNNFGAEPTDGAVSISLYSDNSTTPGSLIASIGALASVDTSLAEYDFTGLSVALAANTRYWVQLDGSNESTAAWAYYVTFSSDFGPGVGGEYWYRTGDGAHPNAGDPDFFPAPYQMRVLADAVPLPAALPMFAGGAGMLGLLIARRKKRASRS